MHAQHRLRLRPMFRALRNLAEFLPGLPDGFLMVDHRTRVMPPHFATSGLLRLGGHPPGFMNINLWHRRELRHPTADELAGGVLVERLLER